MKPGRIVILWSGQNKTDRIGLVTKVDHDGKIATVLTEGVLERWSVEKLLLMNYREI